MDKVETCPQNEGEGNNSFSWENLIEPNKANSADAKSLAAD
jgi:hypothetical protein